MFFEWLFGKHKRESGGGGVKPELLIFGLGNPGVKYGGTRHNIGFDAIDGLASGDTSVYNVYSDCESECGAAAFGANRKPVLLVKPQTYMNLSGDAVGALIGKYGLTAADILVIVDDFNIPLGKIRFRKDGSAGGHNGLKSITEAIGPNYPRLRVGIGPLPAGISVIDFVLGRFEPDENEKVKGVTKLAAEAVVFMIENGIDNAMNKYN